MNLTPAQRALKAAVVALAVHPDAVPGRGASTPFAFFCSHESDLLLRLTREGRIREFARAGWDPEEIADPADPATFENSKLKWDELSDAPHATILDTYRALFGLRRTRPALGSPWADSVETTVEGRRCCHRRADGDGAPGANFRRAGRGRCRRRLRGAHPHHVDAPAAVGDGVVKLPPGVTRAGVDGDLMDGTCSALPRGGAGLPAAELAHPFGLDDVSRVAGKMFAHHRLPDQGESPRRAARRSSCQGRARRRPRPAPGPPFIFPLPPEQKHWITVVHRARHRGRLPPDDDARPQQSPAPTGHRRGDRHRRDRVLGLFDPVVDSYRTWCWPAEGEARQI